MPPPPPQTPAQHQDAEQHVQRNPHPDFKSVEATRPDWADSPGFHYTKTRAPDWKLGQGASSDGDGDGDGDGEGEGEEKKKKKEQIQIDPYAEGRPSVWNYKLLISAIVPRPIGFVSTVSVDGKSTNLSPFSYTQVINHDPPLFIIGFAGPLSPNPKDTLKNLSTQHECTINIISEHYLEAANATAINAPYGVSEWSLSGLHPAPSTDVKPARVQEAVFAVEAKLVSTQEFESRATPGKKSGTLAIVEGVKFWVRREAVNEEGNLVDMAVLKPMSRLGGISYGRTVEAVELPRLEWSEHVQEAEAAGLVKGKVDGQ